MSKTWTCRCRQHQLALKEIRLFPGPDETEAPKWIYQCPGCHTEAVAVPMAGSGAPLFSWLAPAEDDDTELGGRIATAEELTRLGDILANNAARDEHRRRVVWQ